MMRGLAAFVVLAAMGFSATADAAQRVALVMGIGAYQGAAVLQNPVADASALSQTLKDIGFEVILATDVDRRGAIAAIDQFSKAIDGAELALLFFAGHGIQIGGQNFLLPTDVSVESERALRYSAVDIQEVVGEMERRAGVTIAILDACRDNPFLELISKEGGTRSAATSRGLAVIKPSGRGAIIAYAAAAGDVAADGRGKHSPFTAALLEEIDEPGVEVGLMFRRVARRVMEETRGDQRPELLVRLVDEVYLNGTAGPTSVAAAPAAQPQAPAAAETAQGSEAPAEPVVAANADAGRKAEVPAAAYGPEGERFFGTRIVHPPPWLPEVKVREPSRWAAAAALPAIEASGNDSYATAQALPLAATVAAGISPVRDQDWYQVDVPTAGELTLDIDPVPANLDIYARVWDANHAVVADWQTGSGPGGAIAARFPLPGPGRYWIEMSDGNNDQESAEAFDARIDFRPADDPFEPNNGFGAAVPIPSEAKTSAAIYPRADTDWYQLWIPEPGLLTVAASNVPATLDIAMRIWNLDGQVVRDWAVPPRPGGDTLIEAELARPGIYLVETADANNDAGAVEPFDIAVNFAAVGDMLEPNNTFGDAVIVPPVGDRPVAIFPRGDADWLAIDVDHPGELKLAATELPENLDVNMRVWTADKVVLRDWFGPPRAGGDVGDYADLPAPGRYFVEIVDGNNDQASPESFSLSAAFTPEPDQFEPNNGPADATPLTPGGKIPFNILPRSDADWFRVEAAAPGELAVTIDESPADLDLYFRVWDANRQVVRDWVAPPRKGGVAAGYADLPRPGAYFVEVSDGNNDGRSVEHATLATAFTAIAEVFEPNNGYGSATPIKLGDAYWTNILPVADSDWYLIEAPGPGAFTVVADEVDPELDIYVRLWNADAVAGNWYGPPRKGGVTTADLAVPAAGLYRLEVVDGNNDARSKTPFRLKVDFH